MTAVEQASQSRRCAVIYNPTKVSDKFRAQMEESLQRDGWGNTLWLETSAEDPGRAMTKQAVAEQVDPATCWLETWIFHLRKWTLLRSPLAGRYA